MPALSTHQAIQNKNIIEKNNDDIEHNELALFALQDVHEALDHTLDYLVKQNDEIIEYIKRQTHTDESIILGVASYDGSIEMTENKTIERVLSDSSQNTIPDYEIMRESLSEVIRNDETDTLGYTMYEHHKFTEKVTLNPSITLNEKEHTVLSSTHKRKKVVLVIVLLSLMVIILGIGIMMYEKIFIDQ